MFLPKANLRAELLKVDLEGVFGITSSQPFILHLIILMIYLFF